MISALVQELAGWVERLPPRQERMEALAAALREEFGDRAPDARRSPPTPRW